MASLRNGSPGCLLGHRVACKGVASLGVGSVCCLKRCGVTGCRDVVLPVEMWHQWELGQRVACKGVASL